MQLAKDVAAVRCTNAARRGGAAGLVSCLDPCVCNCRFRPRFAPDVGGGERALEDQPPQVVLRRLLTPPGGAGDEDSEICADQRLYCSGLQYTEHRHHYSCWSQGYPCMHRRPSTARGTDARSTRVKRNAMTALGYSPLRPSAATLPVGAGSAHGPAKPRDGRREHESAQPCRRAGVSREHPGQWRAKPGVDRHEGAHRRPAAGFGCQVGVPRGPAGRGRAAVRGRRAGRGGTRARRPAAPDLHLLPPGAGHGCPGGADAAAARRAHHHGDRARLPGLLSMPHMVLVSANGRAPGGARGLHCTVSTTCGR
jgi:hypothetical protein